MPVVDVDPDELRRLTGHRNKDDDELRQDLFGLGIEYEGETEDGDFKLEFEADRLDRLSVEGIARSLRYHYGDDRGVHVPDTNAADWTIRVEDVPEERPYVTGAVIRGVDLDEDALDSLIQLQEKLHATMGRKRAKGAIGIHDLAMLKGEAVQDGDGSPGKSITYTGIEPDGDTFVPLDDDAERTPADVLTEHPTGETYADLLADYETYPAIYDDIGLFSFPPVINGRRTEVSTDSRELFVELTGTDQWTIDRMCAIVCYALDARGATVEDVTVEYADEGRELHRPDFEVRTKHVTHDRIRTLLGVDLTTDDVVDFAERSGLQATAVDDGYDEIVIPTDGSKPATAAVEHGLAIAERADARVHAINVVNVATLSSGPDQTAPTELLAEFTARGERATEEIATAAADRGLDATTTVREGFPARDILDYVEANDADLVAMGTAGRSGLNRFLLGSTTERVVRHSPVPVCAVNARDTE